MMAWQIIAACVALAIVIYYFWNRQRRLNAMLKFGCVICILIIPAACDDDKTAFPVVRPMVFPEGMIQAERMIEVWLDNSTDHDLFLSDGYFPFKFNNTTVIA